MKKTTILSIAIVLIAMMGSCTSKSRAKANLKTDIDSLSYAYGANYTEGLIPYLEQMGVDSTQLKDFIKGWIEGASLKTDDKEMSAYLIGVDIGKMVGGEWFDGINQQIFGNDPANSLSKNNFMAGFVESVLNKNVKMDILIARGYIELKAQEIQERQMEALYVSNRDEGVRFLEANRQNNDVIALPSGLQYKVITQGSGPVPTRESLVRVNYHGTLIDGTVFDSSIDRGRPSEFYANDVLAGWTEALQLMPVGSKWILYIPQELAYGAMDMGIIKPFSTLIFEVELLDIVM